MSNYTPSTKVATGTVGGALAILIVWIVGTLGVEMPAEVGTAIGVLTTAFLAWLVPDKKKGRYEAE